MFIAVFLYILTIIIGVYAVYVNLPALIEIGIPANTLEFSRFLVSLIPVAVGLFMIYFGISSIYTLFKKNKEENR
jgi:uncharacterized BrkB/YihY/UPF0761 family membrane protein